MKYFLKMCSIYWLQAPRQVRSTGLWRDARCIREQTQLISKGPQFMRHTGISITLPVRELKLIQFQIIRFTDPSSTFHSTCLFRLVLSPCLLIPSALNVCNMKQLHIFWTKWIQMRTTSFARKQSWDFKYPLAKKFLWKSIRFNSCGTSFAIWSFHWLGKTRTTNEKCYMDQWTY